MVSAGEGPLWHRGDTAGSKAFPQGPDGSLNGPVGTVCPCPSSRQGLRCPWSSWEWGAAQSSQKATF
jgi:hypothetical protein